MSVWVCATCDSWHDGAGYFPTNVARDPWGRVEREARDDPATPRYCSEACRDRGELETEPARLVSRDNSDHSRAV